MHSTVSIFLAPILIILVSILVNSMSVRTSTYPKHPKPQRLGADLSTGVRTSTSIFFLGADLSTSTSIGVRKRISISFNFSQLYEC